MTRRKEQRAISNQSFNQKERPMPVCAGHMQTRSSDANIKPICSAYASENLRELQM